MDPVVDMFNIIKNGQAVLKATVDVPFSKFKYEIAKILEKEGYAGKIEKKKRKNKQILQIELKYNKGVPAINEIRKVSKSGQRIYLPYKKIVKVKGGFGMAIVSTPKGLLRAAEAKKQKLGGEIIAEIW